MKKFYIATMGAKFRGYAREKDLGVEIDFFCMAENLEGEKYDGCCREVERLMSDCDISGEELTLHAPFNELHPAAIDPAARDLAGMRMEQSYKVCERFGIKKMIVHSGYLPRVYFKSWHIERSVEFWTEFMADKPKDFRLCIENVLEDEPQMMADMLEQIRAEGNENIGICFDIGHANCTSDVDVMTWLDVLAPYINHFHIHNNDGDYDMHRPPDQGSIDIKGLIDKAEIICDEEVTYTCEVMDLPDAVDWLERKGYI